MTDLVLGTAFGYGVDRMRPFVESVREHYDGDVALLVVGNTPADVLSYYDAHRIEPIFFDASAWMFPDVQVTRYMRYADLLRGRADVERVLLTDVGDVIFQAHPFEQLPPGDLLVFMEDASKAIGACASNALWIRELYGLDALKQLAARRVSCSGTTIGTRAAMLAYLEAIMREARPDVLQKLRPLRGYDQGMHNMLLHTGRLPGARPIENGTHVFTLAHVPDENIAISERGIAVAKTGEFPAIVHQYPYKSIAADWVAKRYASAADVA